MRYSTILNTVLLMAWIGAGWALAQQAATHFTVTLDRSMHFTSPEGNDIEVPAGTYQVEAAGELHLRLSPAVGGVSLFIQAWPTTHTEAVESPVVLAVAVDEDRIHLVLLLPDQIALDALGSASAVRPRAALSPLPLTQLKQAYSDRLAQAGALRQLGRPMQESASQSALGKVGTGGVGPTLSPELAVISTMLAEGKPSTAVLDAWKGYVSRQVQSRQPLDVQATLQQVIGQAHAQVKARADADRKRLTDKMNMMGDDAQLANLEMQNLLQKQQQTLQMMSSLSKIMYDTATAIIRKIGG